MGLKRLLITVLFVSAVPALAEDPAEATGGVAEALGCCDQPNPGETLSQCATRLADEDLLANATPNCQTWCESYDGMCLASVGAAIFSPVPPDASCPVENMEMAYATAACSCVECSSLIVPEPDPIGDPDPEPLYPAEMPVLTVSPAPTPSPTVTPMPTLTPIPTATPVPTQTEIPMPPPTPGFF